MDEPVDQIQEDFEVFHRENPRVFALFDRFTRDMIEAGYKRGSAGLIAERIRWETNVVTRGEPVKINNNYRACYSRRWEEVNPEYRGFFTMRERRAETFNSVPLDPEAKALI